jgi:hypothetical protein
MLYNQLSTLSSSAADTEDTFEAPIQRSSSHLIHIVIWRLKVGTVEPEETYIAKQRFGKQFSAATDMQATIEELLGTMFSIRSVQSGYKEKFS